MQFMGATDTHLMKKLNSIHEKAQRIGNFTIGPLKSKREAAILFTLKWLDGQAARQRCAEQLMLRSSLITQKCTNVRLKMLHRAQVIYTCIYFITKTKK